MSSNNKEAPTTTPVTIFHVLLELDDSSVGGVSLIRDGGGADVGGTDVGGGDKIHVKFTRGPPHRNAFPSKEVAEKFLKTPLVGTSPDRLL